MPKRRPRRALAARAERAASESRAQRATAPSAAAKPPSARLVTSSLWLHFVASLEAAAQRRACRGQPATTAPSRAAPSNADDRRDEEEAVAGAAARFKKRAERVAGREVRARN